MKNSTILMEDYFNPGFKIKPAVHIGSQTVDSFLGNAEEQAWEGCALTAASGNDLAIVRNLDKTYLDYWQSLMDNPQIINIEDKINMGKYLTQVISERPDLLDLISKKMIPNSTLMAFMITSLEQKLADRLKIPLHGSVEISSLYGTKSGIRKLAQEVNIQMTPGFVCTKVSEVEDAVAILSKSFEVIVLKHDQSLSGYFSKKLDPKKIMDVKIHLDEISKGGFVEGKDIVVVEGWVNGRQSLCAHIEIMKDKDPIICAAWQQIIHSDGISYMGAGPLRLSPKAIVSLNSQVNKLAAALKGKGAIGSYGPDFLVTMDDECILIELNARVPYTAFPIEAIKQIKGKIGDGFLSRHIKPSKPTTFLEIKEVLQKEGLLIKEKNTKVRGVVPYNIGLLPWNIFDIVVMADSWEEVLPIAEKVISIFERN